ncbi:MAG: ribosome-associated translation inhibitor RaiA [Bacilli bacterium]|nr:ribosome-associated translation inhibitor RaiA [Bacilli bacterium]
MKFNIRGEKVKVTDAIRSHIEEKIGRLDRYFETPDTLTANVLVKVQGINQIVEVTIPAKKFILRGEVKDKDLYAAIDFVSDKLERQIRKNKTRMNKNNKKSPVIDFVVDFEAENIEQDETKIVKRKLIEMKPMSEEEAILQMNLLDHAFYIFKNSDTNELAVVYRRQDNNYGIIEVK